MSLLDNLGSGQVTQSIQPRQNNRMGNLMYVANLLKGRNMNPKNLAINMLNQNSRLNGQLKQFLYNNGITDEQLKQNGINI